MLLQAHWPKASMLPSTIEWVSCTISLILTYFEGNGHVSRPVMNRIQKIFQNSRDFRQFSDSAFSSVLRQCEALVDIQIVWFGHWESVTWIQDFDSRLAKIGLVIGDARPQVPPYDRLHQQEAWYSWRLPRLLIQRNYMCLIDSCQSN